jgi:hypothetical protein
MPPPNHYNVTPDWKEEMTSYALGGSPNKGKFLKSEKITLCAEIIKHSKKEAKPGPGTYDLNDLNKPYGLSKTKE